MANAPVNTNSNIDIRREGLRVLNEALGPVGMVRFMQQYENGTGDYTKEKYDLPDLSIDDIDAILKKKK